MNQQLENATIDYLQTLKELGIRKIDVSVETLQALKNKKVSAQPRTVPKNQPGKMSSQGQNVTMERDGRMQPQLQTQEEDQALLNLSLEEKISALAKLSSEVSASTAYRAMFKYAKNMVFGVGAADAKIMFIGEAPGADEDEQGEPFVGRAGQLLTKMIQAMGLQRADVYIGNIVKYRPDMPPGSSGNRKPTLEEIAISRPYICEQIRIIQPKVLVALGATAVEGLFKTGKATITQRRGNWAEFLGIPLMPTYHPAYLLRNPVNSEKRKVWEDLLKVMEKAGLSINEKQRGYFLTK